MSATEKVVNALNVSKLMLCNPKMLTSEMCVRIGQAINGAIDLLKEQEAVKPQLSISGMWYECPICHRHMTKDRDNYCARCGREVKWE